MDAKLTTEEHTQVADHVLTVREMIEKLKEEARKPKGSISWMTVLTTILQGAPAIIALFNLIFNPKVPVQSMPPEPTPPAA